MSKIEDSNLCNKKKGFFSWTKSHKKVFSKYDVKEISHLGVIILEVVIRLN